MGIQSSKSDPDLAGFEEANKLGRKGWELVAAVPKTELGITGSVYFIFKREMLQEAGGDKGG